MIDGMGINVIMEYVTEHGPRGMCVWRPSVLCGWGDESSSLADSLVHDC